MSANVVIKMILLLLLILAYSIKGQDSIQINPPECGLRFNATTSPDRASRIIGGHDSDIHFYPWLASIIRIKLINYSGRIVTNYKHFCGGSIINRRWILTAAHCLAPLEENSIAVQDLRIVVGHSNPKQMVALEEDLDDIYHVEKMIFGRCSSVGHDIGLLKTTRPITYRMSVSPICLPTLGSDPDMSQPAEFAGWGRTERPSSLPAFLRLWPERHNHLLQQSVFIIQQPTECRWASVGFFMYVSLMGDKVICTLDFSRSTACFGDSGSPLIQLDRSTGRYVQVGIASSTVRPWLAAKCPVNSPVIHTKVSRFVDWIGQQMVTYDQSSAKIIISKCKRT